MRITRAVVIVLAGALAVILGLIIHDMRRAPVHGTSPVPAPLTDLAPHAAPTSVSADEAPWRRAAERHAPDPAGPVATPIAPVPPTLMANPNHPPSWTQPLATPKTPVPPNPARPPSMAVDPEAGRRVR